jgi:hypothetical protein
MPQDRVEIVLDCRLAGDVCLRSFRSPEGPLENDRGRLRSREVELRYDRALDKVCADCSEWPGLAGRDHACRTVDFSLKVRQQRSVCRASDLEDDEVFAVAAITEAMLKDRLGPSGVRSGHTEVVRQQSAESRRGEAARKNDGEPDGKDEPAPPQDPSRPALHIVGSRADPPRVRRVIRPTRDGDRSVR